MSRRRPISIAKRQDAGSSPKTTQVIRFISAIVETIVGADEKPSPLLESLIEDLGADPDDVEIAQDITLLALEIMEAVSRAVDSGNAASLPFELVSIVAPAIPELQSDIEKLRD